MSFSCVFLSMVGLWKCGRFRAGPTYAAVAAERMLRDSIEKGYGT